MGVREVILILAGLGGIILFINIYLTSSETVKAGKSFARAGRLLYSGARRAKGLVYETEEYKISCKPDEIYELPGKTIVVVCYLNGLNPAVSDYYKYKMGACFLAAEASLKRTPAYGILEDLKTGETVRIDNTGKFKKEVLSQLAAMTDLCKGSLAGSITRLHEDSIRCSACPFYADCSLALKEHSCTASVEAVPGISV